MQISTRMPPCQFDYGDILIGFNTDSLIGFSSDILSVYNNLTKLLIEKQEKGRKQREQEEKIYIQGE